MDDSGRRHAQARRIGRLVIVGFAAYFGLMVVGVARDPRVGPLHLPTFGLPTLGLMTPPAPSVLGEDASRAASAADLSDAAPETRPETTAPTTAAKHRAATPPTTVPSTGPASTSDTDPTTATEIPATTPPTTAATTTTTAPPKPGNSPKPTTTTTTAVTTDTPSTTTTTVQNGQGQGPSSAKGPAGDGAPGQLRRTTPTTGPAA